MSEPNAEIPIFQGSLSLYVDDSPRDFDGALSLAWLPKPSVRFNAERQSEIDDLKRIFQDRRSEGVGLIRAGESSYSFSFVPGNWNFNLVGKTRVDGEIVGPVSLGDGAGMRRIDGQIANLDEYRIPGRREFNWEGDGWSVTIAPVANLSKLIKSLRSAGGYAITHQMTLKRADEGSFSVPEAEAALHGTFRFLSFIEGRKVQAVLPVGYDEHNSVVWRQLGSWNVDPWQGVDSWVDPHTTEHFCEAFAGFMQLWRDPRWRDALDAAIHWYVDSNRNASVIEAGAIFNQMALELLAWEHLVIHTKAMTPEGFHRLAAADRIRLILTQNGIPLATPTQLTRVTRWAKEFNWVDIADAITAMRNVIVHPEHKLRDRVDSPTEGCVLDVWKCGLWALELLLLRMFCYSGGYQDRRRSERHVGHPDSVPWQERAQFI